MDATNGVIPLQVTGIYADSPRVKGIQRTTGPTRKVSAKVGIRAFPATATRIQIGRSMNFLLDLCSFF